MPDAAFLDLVGLGGRAWSEGELLRRRLGAGRGCSLPRARSERRSEQSEGGAGRGAFTILSFLKTII